MKAFILLLISVCCAFGQQQDDNLKDVEKIIGYIAESNFKDAASLLNERYSPWTPDDVKESLIDSMRQLGNEKIIGKFNGHEIVKDKSFGKSVRTIGTILKYDRQPIYLSFDFYNPDGKEWILIGLYLQSDR